MAKPSVTQFSSFINQQIQSQEQIEECLGKLEALIAVAVMTDGFYDLPKVVLHTYFSIAGDLIEVAMKANQASLGDLLKQEKANE